MKRMKKLAALALSLTMALSLCACGEKKEELPDPDLPPVEEPEAETPSVTTRVAALKGPTGMGLAYLEEGEGDYALTIAAKPDEINPLLLKGELDVACVPANAAAVLAKKSEGAMVTLGINTLGVLYLVENGETVQSLSDLKGQTLVASGKGATPEYALRYLLSENGIDPDTDLDIQWKSEHSECVAALATGAASIALLPQPFVTVAQGKIEGLRMALDLTQEWEKLDNGSQLLTGVVVARKDFVEAEPQAVSQLLKDYALSVEKVNADPAAAAVKIGDMGIVEAAVAEKAIPYCNIVCITGAEMKESLSGYLEVLFAANPASVGGELPGEEFYFGA